MPNGHIASISLYLPQGLQPCPGEEDEVLSFWKRKPCSPATGRRTRCSPSERGNPTALPRGGGRGSLLLKEETLQPCPGQEDEVLSFWKRKPCSPTQERWARFSPSERGNPAGLPRGGGRGSLLLTEETLKPCPGEEDEVLSFWQRKPCSPVQGRRTRFSPSERGNPAAMPGGGGRGSLCWKRKPCMLKLCPDKGRTKFSVRVNPAFLLGGGRRTRFSPIERWNPVREPQLCDSSPFCQAKRNSGDPFPPSTLPLPVYRQ